MAFSPIHGIHKEEKEEKESKHPIKKKFSSKSPVKKINLAKNATTKGKIKYMSGQLCDMIKKEEIFIGKKDGKNKNIQIWTPFTIMTDTENGVTIREGTQQKSTQTENKQTENNQNKNLFTCRFGKVESTQYSHFDTTLKKYTAYKKTHLKAIFKYLNMPSDKNVRSIEDFNKIVKQRYLCTDPDLEKKDNCELRQILCVLSAMLMISEPYRFEDQGRQSRALIRRMYQNFGTKLTDSALTMKNAVLLSKVVIDGKTISEKVCKDRKINTKNIDRYKTALKKDSPYMSEDEYDDVNTSSDEVEEKEMKEIKEVPPFKHDFDDEDDVSSDEFEEKEMKEIKEVSSSKYDLDDEEDDDDVSSDEFEEKEMKEIKEVSSSKYDLDDKEDDDERNPKSSSNSSSIEIELEDDNPEDEDEFADDEDEFKSDKGNAMSEDSFNSSSSSSSSESEESSLSDSHSPKKKTKTTSNIYISSDSEKDDTVDLDMFNDDFASYEYNKKKKQESKPRKASNRKKNLKKLIKKNYKTTKK